jgi:hypothetical protein
MGFPCSLYCEYIWSISPPWLSQYMFPPVCKSGNKWTQISRSLLGLRVLRDLIRCVVDQAYEYTAPNPHLLARQKKYNRTILQISPFIFIRNKRNVISSEGFSALEKRAVICLQRGVLHIQSGITALLKIVMAVWRTFLNLKLLGLMWELANYNGCLALHIFKKCTKRPLLSATSDQITHQNSLQRTVKALWGLISRPILNICCLKERGR